MRSAFTLSNGALVVVDYRGDMTADLLSELDEYFVVWRHVLSKKTGLTRAERISEILAITQVLNG